MAFDGTVVANLVWELNQTILNSRIGKIAQPEADELLFTLKSPKGQRRLAMSANASLPFVYLTERNKPSPAAAPNFCMVLRKHVANGRITRISQPGLERVILFEIEHLDDLGDLCRKILAVELMGKHSNIIFCREDGVIIDSIKHIGAQVSSVREVLPGREYFIPETLHKKNPLEVLEPRSEDGGSRKDFLPAFASIGGTKPESPARQAAHASPASQTESSPASGGIDGAGAASLVCEKSSPASGGTDSAGQKPPACQKPSASAGGQAGRKDFYATVFDRPETLCKALYGSYTGLSPSLAGEICTRAGADGDRSARDLDEEEKERVFREFCRILSDVRDCKFSPNIVYRGKEPVEFAALRYTEYEGLRREDFDSISRVLETYYADKDVYTRIRQKSSDLRRIVGTALDRSRRKYGLQQKQLADTAKRDKYRVYGELLNAYGYGLPEGARKLEAVNYYTGETVAIPLDGQLTASENAKKYFDRYGKLKRTNEALTTLVEETKDEIDHLESIATSLDIARTEDDLAQIREELAEFGYIRRKRGDRKQKSKSRPFHYLSSDGFHMYVGKNNYQNDELTFKFATGNDWWFHAKGMPGSHVVVKTEGRDLPDRAFEEAGKLAGYYSKGRGSDKVEIDYLQRKNVKKPNKSAPGFVVYYTNYSMTIHPDLEGLTEITETGGKD